MKEEVKSRNDCCILTKLTDNNSWAITLSALIMVLIA